MAELADVQDLGSCGEIRVGSTPTTRTRKAERQSLSAFLVRRMRRSGRRIVRGGRIFSNAVDTWEKIC